MKIALKVLALGVAIAASATMAKADTIFYNVIVTNATTCTAGCSIGSGSSTTGSLAQVLNGDGFGVVLTADGSPLQSAPNFSTSSFNIENNGTAAGTVTIMVSDVGLTSGTPSLTLNTFGTNSLDAPSFLNDTISNYYDSSNATYGTASLLATVTYNGDGSFSTGPVAALLSAGTPYSETTIYTLNFGADSGGSQTVSASSQIIAATPEPSSLALLGTGLLGAAGMARRRFLHK